MLLIPWSGQGSLIGDVEAEPGRDGGKAFLAEGIESALMPLQKSKEKSQQPEGEERRAHGGCSQGR